MNGESAPEFFFVPRGPGGGLTKEGRGMVKRLAPGGFEFSGQDAPDPEGPHGKVLDELRRLLPRKINFPEVNPFLVFKVAKRVDPIGPRAACKCQCGAGYNCGGGGGGS